MSKGLKKLSVFFVVLFVIIYLAGVFYFSSKSFPNTTVNGVDRSLVSKDTLFEINKGNKKINLTGRNDKNLELSSSDINFSKEIKGTPEHNQNAWLWPIEVLQDHKYEIEFNTRYDEGKLKDLVQTSSLMSNQKDPVDAEVIYSEENKAFEIQPEELGTKLDAALVEKAIVKAFEDDTQTVSLEEMYVKPELTKDSDTIKEELAQAEAIATKHYKFDFDDRVYDLTGKELYELYDHADGKSVLNQDRLHEYIRNIARETDTYGTQRKFNTTGKGEITVPAGIYGWQMNVQKTKENVLAMIDEGKDGVVDINYNIEGTVRAKDDIGDTYIEVDLSRQTAWYYKDGVLDYQTPMVSGTASIRNAATPIGVNMVWTKERDRMLRGTSEMTGVPYEVPIKYWMNVGWTGSGFHDTDYRKNYGGDIYLTNGSSSCMNIPPENMAILFSKVSVGTPVVIYESSTNYSPTEFEKIEINRLREQETTVTTEDNRG